MLLISSPKIMPLVAQQVSIIPFMERGLYTVPRVVMDIPANQSVNVLANQTLQNQVYYVAVYLFNAGDAGQRLWYNYVAECDNIENFCGWMDPSQQLRVDTLTGLSVYSTTGSKIAFTIIARDPNFSASPTGQ